MPSEDFPKGWPIRCPNCAWWNFTYTSERTGNIRRYTCKKCGDMYLATWKGKPVRSVFNEPRNTRMEDWIWARIVEPHTISADSVFYRKKEVDCVTRVSIDVRTRFGKIQPDDGMTISVELPPYTIYVYEELDITNYNVPCLQLERMNHNATTATDIHRSLGL